VPVPRTYLDYAATTPLDPRVLADMIPYLEGFQANPNSLHTSGREANRALEEARHQVASLVGAHVPDEIVFNGGGTEGDLAAIVGLTEARRATARKRIVISAIEHHAVLEAARRLGSRGFQVTQVRPGADGIVSPERLSEALGDDVALVSVMMANNETGALQPVRELAELAHGAGALFHTDAVQALGKCAIDLEELGVDAASFSTHKIYGPKGCGFLYLHRGVPFVTQLPGGGQEGNRRSGTQNLAGIRATACALRLAEAEREAETERERGLQDLLISSVLASCGPVRLTVDPRTAPERYLPNIVSFLVEGWESEMLILRLDELGFEVSAASACSSGSLEPSHVLTAMGVPRDLAFGSLRISLGRPTTEQEVRAFGDALASIFR